MTYSIDIKVDTNYIKEQSSPDKNFFAFSYTISITNTGTEPATLLRRHWIIKDFNQKVLEVQGDGVIGKQPRLLPGEDFIYTSGTSMETDVGTMSGSYTMQTDEGELFEAPIAEFVLAVPQQMLH